MYHGAASGEGYVRIVTLNCNGIRSAARKGLFDWLAGQDADVVCLQETRAQEHQLEAALFRPAGYHCHYFDAARPGYAGVALFARREPDRVVRGFGIAEFDSEGRYLEACFGRLSVISLYLPSGSAGPGRQASKFRFLDAFLPHLARLRRRRLAPQERDRLSTVTLLARWRGLWLRPALRALTSLRGVSAARRGARSAGPAARRRGRSRGPRSLHRKPINLARLRRRLWRAART